MPFFNDTESLLVVEKQFEYNTEVVDGKLVLLPDTTLVCILKHTPTNKFTYNVSAFDKTPVIYAKIKIKSMGAVHKQTPPVTFYTMVMPENIDKYILKNKYNKINLYTPNKITHNAVITNINPPEKKLGLKTTGTDTPGDRNYSLSRTSESPTYTYKQPNLR